MAEIQPECSFKETPRDSRKAGDPIDLTPYIWNALKYSGLTDQDCVEFGMSVDRSMSINLNRALNGLVFERTELRAEVQRLREALQWLKRGSCWCEMAIGNPMARRHSKGCGLASALAGPQEPQT